MNKSLQILTSWFSGTTYIHRYCCRRRRHHRTKTTCLSNKHSCVSHKTQPKQYWITKACIRLFHVHFINVWSFYGSFTIVASLFEAFTFMLCEWFKIKLEKIWNTLQRLISQRISMEKNDLVRLDVFAARWVSATK